MVSSIDRLAFQHTLQVDNSRPGSYFFQPISPPFFFPIKWAGDSIESFLAVFLYIDSASSNLIIFFLKTTRETRVSDMHAMFSGR